MRALNTPLSVAIVGEFNAGKSTLINALIGEEIVPMGILPTTAHTGILRYGPRQVARVVWRGDEDAVEVDFAEAKRLMKDNASEIDHLQYWIPHPELRAVHYWDTPGFNALEERHEEVARRALEEAEAILWVLDANQVLSQTEFELIEGIPSGSERLIVVINKIDRLGEPEERAEAVEQLMEYVLEHAGEHIAGCYPISALQALREEETSHGFEAFTHHLNAKIIARAGRIKTIEGGAPRRSPRPRAQRIRPGAREPLQRARRRGEGGRFMGRGEGGRVAARRSHGESNSTRRTGSSFSFARSCARSRKRSSRAPL